MKQARFVALVLLALGVPWLGGGCPEGSGDTEVDALSSADVVALPDVPDVVDVVDVTAPEDVGAEGLVDADSGADAAGPEETAEGDASIEELPPAPVTGIDPPPMPADTLGFTPPEREPDGEPPTPEEIAAFTRQVTGFFKDTAYFDWVYRVTHGLDASYDPEMMPYRLWWQATNMRREGDTVIFAHHNYAENIAKRTVKVIDGAAAGHLLTGDPRMAEVAADLMRGMVALALAFETEREDPPRPYLQARAVFTHDHTYEVDGRKIAVEYGATHETKGKWNVHAFEIPDNPTYGTVWVNNMRSKDDVPYMFHTLAVATRVYHQTAHAELREAARLYIEYMRGFAQSIVDDQWFILTRYADGVAAPAVDTTKSGSPPADLGSFVHWEAIFGPDAECNAQLGAALAGYGYPAGKGHCDRGQAGALFEDAAGAGNWFNHNIYNYFHIAALSVANLWGYGDIAASLLDGLIERLVEMRTDPNVPNRDHKEFESDSAGWLITAASQGDPLDAREARHIMKWYGESADWYRGWEHWDPWATLPEGQLFEFKPPRDEAIDDGQGGPKTISHVRAVEMPYVFEYCQAPLKAPESVPFIDCEVVADPSRWGE